MKGTPDRPWTELEEEELIRLHSLGNTATTISRMMGRTFASVRSKIVILRAKGLLESRFIPTKEHEVRIRQIASFAPPEMEIYDDFKRVKGDAMIFSDTHCPYEDERVFDMGLAVAKKHLPKGNRQCILAGDLFDHEQFSRFETANRGQQQTEDEFIHAEHLLARLLQVFDRIYMIMGNHENRYYKVLSGQIKAERFYKLLDHELNKRIKISRYMYCELNDDWYICHPSKFSQMGGKTPADIALVEQKNVIAGHNHMWGMQATKCGKFVGIDHGCSCDPEKVFYYKTSATGMAKWQQGFSMVKNGKASVFNMRFTDWKLWL